MDDQGTVTAQAVGAWAPPADDERLRIGDLGALVRRQQRRLVRQARQADRPALRQLLVEHLRCDPDRVVVVEEAWPSYDLVNVQLALEHWLDGREHQLVGLARTRHREFGLTDLLHQDGDDPHDHGPVAGTPSWTTQAAGPGGAVRRALRAGLFLTADDGDRVALLLVSADPESGRQSTALHVAAEREEVAAAVAARLRALAIEHNVYRGQVLSFGGEVFDRSTAFLRFHSRPEVTADDVILPADVLTTVRQQVVGVARHRDRLLAAGQHLKRGLLLHGPPGVGKTHTVRHLMSELTDVTIVNLSGDALQLIREACSVARALQPAMVVIEDVDLIAQDRDRYHGETPLLFELLNQMDGLDADADVVFLLTTNRADLLEAALAARPGRVDQAVALELPDAEGRRRLVDLYRGRLDLDDSRLDGVVARTEGVTASFVKELLRRAALRAAEADDAATAPAALRVSADHLDDALDELLDSRNAMTRVMLGSTPPSRTPDAADS